MSLEKLFKDKLPEGILSIINRLKARGFQGYLVGGAVRDILLDRPRKGLWDLATDATPEQVISIFPRTAPTGIKYGTVTVFYTAQGGEFYPLAEVTTFRVDDAYSDARRPDRVFFSRRIEEDLSRRDFTINAMAYDPSADVLIDLFAGRRDLERRIIRAVGYPEARFREDGLRPFRAARFAATLDFEIDEATMEAIPKALAAAKLVSAERIREELMRMLDASKPSRGFEVMRRAGLLKLVLAELLEGYGMEQNDFHKYDVYHHALAACDEINRPPEAIPPPPMGPADAISKWDYIYGIDRPRLLRLAGLLHDVGKSRTRQLIDGIYRFYNHSKVGAIMAEDIMRRLKFSNNQIKYVVSLVENHLFNYEPSWSDAAVRRFIKRVGLENTDDLFELRRADSVATGATELNLAALEEFKGRIKKVVSQEQALKLSDLAVDGTDVMRVLNIEPGPEVGRVLAQLLEAVIDEPGLNEREVLLELIGKIGLKSP